MLAWLDRLADRSVFAGFESIFELGPQDLFVPRAQLEYSARRRMPSAEAAAAVEEPAVVAAPPLLEPTADGAASASSDQRRVGTKRRSGREP